MRGTRALDMGLMYLSELIMMLNYGNAGCPKKRLAKAIEYINAAETALQRNGHDVGALSYYAARLGVKHWNWQEGIEPCVEDLTKYFNRLKRELNKFIKAEGGIAYA